MANKKNVRTDTKVIITRVICIIIAGLMMLGVIVAAILSASAVEKASERSANTDVYTSEMLSTRSKTVTRIGGEYTVGDQENG